MEAQHWIFLSDGPRTGEHVVVDAGPDGDAPAEVTLLDPPADPKAVAAGAPDSTTYWRVHVEKGMRSQPPPRMYQSATPPRRSSLFELQPQTKPH
jgi:hypothetical protein